VYESIIDNLRTLNGMLSSGRIITPDKKSSFDPQIKWNVIKDSIKNHFKFENSKENYLNVVKIKILLENRRYKFDVKDKDLPNM
jgi:hypothetical protein